VQRTTIRTYSELVEIPDFVERFRYLAVRAGIGTVTFGHERWLNQRFYTSKEWRDLRHYVIARDNGCDLAVPGNEIHAKLVIHHMNPIRRADIIHREESIMDPEYLITTSLRTHNAIHFGDEGQLPRPFVERQRGDTQLWRRRR
jgi:hypothetical protein